MAKYQIMLSDKTGHVVRSLKVAVALAGGLPFITRKILRGGKKSKRLRKYEVLGRMAHCVATRKAPR